MIKRVDTKENRVDLVPSDNHTLYINGVEVVGIRRCDIDICEGEVIISFPATVGVKNE